METGRKVNVIDTSASEIAVRATWYVNQVDTGAHADKRVASRFGISVSMAKLLRKGQGWTLARVEQARRSFGPSFDHMVFGPLAGQANAGGRDALETEIAELQSVVHRLAASWRRGPLDAGAGDLVDRGIDDPLGLAPRVAGADIGKGFAGAELDGRDPRRPAAMDAAVKRAAE